MDQNDKILPAATTEDIIPDARLSADEYYAKNPEPTKIPENEKPRGSSAIAVLTGEDAALQNQYIAAIIQYKPGLGVETSSMVARDLINSGIQATEALMVINLVYGGPNGLAKQGQTTRLRHFSEAVREVWGDRLEKASKHPALFRGLLAKMNEATELHDDLSQEDPGYSLSFKDSLVLQEIGVDSEYFFGLAESLVTEYGISRIAAKMRIKEAANLVRMNQAASLENILFPIKPSSTDEEHYEQ